MLRCGAGALTGLIEKSHETKNFEQSINSIITNLLKFFTLYDILIVHIGDFIKFGGMSMSIIEVYDNYSCLGINSRPITSGQEFDMVNEFINYKKEIFKETSQKKLAIFIETKINNAYPDVIFAEYNPYFYETWNKNRDNLTTDDLKILHYIFSKRNVTSRKIIKDLSIQYKSLLCSLEALIDAELIDRKNKYWIIPNKSDIFGVKRIEAVEAKISKWDKVMQQAIINKSFASDSFVLSKRKHEPRSEVVEKISSFGIGIYLYDDEHFSCYKPSQHNRFPSNYNSIYLNECIGKILNFKG